MAIQTRLEDMVIGDKIISKYVAASGQVGVFSELGSSVAAPIPAASSATPNGSFYWIHVGNDFKGRKILVAEKNIQHSINWDELNTEGISTSSGLPFKFYSNKIVPMTHHDTTVADSSAIPSVDYAPWKAFDGLISTDHINACILSGSSGWISHDFKQVTDAVAYRITGRGDANANTYSPKNWTFEGWDGSSWIILDTQTNITSWSGSQTKLFALSQKQSFTKYRLNISSNNGGENTQVTELEILEESFSNYKTNIRLLTGGVSDALKANSEWDKYIVNATGGGQYPAGDIATWNITSGIRSWTSTSYNAGNRVIRGASVATDYYWYASGDSNQYAGFRPVLVAESLQAPTTYKYLIKDQESIKAYVNSAWSTVGTAPATEEMFTTSGMTNLTSIPKEAWIQLGSNFSVLEYINQVADVASALNVKYADKGQVARTANLTAIPKPQILLPIGDIEVGELESVRVDANAFSGYSDIKANANMTANNAPSPFLVEASSSNASAWNLFNGTTSAWDASISMSPVWVTYKFDNKRVIGKYVISSYTEKSAPRDWKLEGSNDNIQWKTVDERIGESNWKSNEVREYRVSHPDSFLYYRLYVAKNNGESYMYLRGIEYYEYSSGNADIKILASGDSGSSWRGKTSINLSDLSDVKANGFTSVEFNALTKEELKTLFPNSKARFAFYLEQEKSTDVVQINSLTINQMEYTLTPSIQDASITYEMLKADQPKAFISRNDGADWIEVNPDQLINLEKQPDGKKLRVKFVLASGQEIHAYSYSWI